MCNSPIIVADNVSTLKQYLLLLLSSFSILKNNQKETMVPNCSTKPERKFLLSTIKERVFRAQWKTAHIIYQTHYKYCAVLPSAGFNA